MVIFDYGDTVMMVPVMVMMMTESGDDGDYGLFIARADRSIVRDDFRHG